MAKNDAGGLPRTETDTSLRVERHNTDYELAKRVADADADADQLLEVARKRADVLLAAGRAAVDARLPLVERTKAAVALLLQQREREDDVVASEREGAAELLSSERREREGQVAALLVLERHATDIRLALERTSADKALSSRDDFFAQVSHDLGQLMAAEKIYWRWLLRRRTTASAVAGSPRT